MAESPAARSKIARVGTIGTFPAAVGTPRPISSKYCITPSAAARPKADPPVRQIPSTDSTALSTARRSSSREAGAPPRTSPEATLPSGSSMTVHPVCASVCVQCPILTPETPIDSVRSMMRPLSPRWLIFPRTTTAPLRSSGCTSGYGKVRHEGQGTPLARL